MQHLIISDRMKGNSELLTSPHNTHHELPLQHFLPIRLSYVHVLGKHFSLRNSQPQEIYI